MSKKKLVQYSLVHSLGVFVYVTLVGWLMANGERIFGKLNSLWGPVAFLLLFVLSATIVGLLVLGRPVYLYFNGMKTESLRMFFYTLGWLVAITTLVFLGLWLY